MSKPLKNNQLENQNSQIILEEDERNYRTEIPNIILEMLAAGILTPSAFILYSVYRRIAGQKGRCFVGYRKLMKLARMTDYTFREARKLLTTKFKMLNGKSLVILSPGNKKLETADTITITDIWPENYYYFKNKLTCVNLECTPALKESAPLREFRVQKKEPHKKEPIKKQQETFSAREAEKPKVEQHVVPCGAVVVCENEGKKRVDKKTDVLQDDVFFYANATQKDWSCEEILEAYKSFKNSKYDVSDPFKYIEGIITKKRNIKTAEGLKCRPKKTEKTPEKKPEENIGKSSLPIGKQVSLENDIEERPLARYLSRKRMRQK